MSCYCITKTLFSECLASAINSRLLNGNFMSAKLETKVPDQKIMKPMKSVHHLLNFERMLENFNSFQ